MILAPVLKQGFLQSRVYMDTIVTIELSEPGDDRFERVDRAFRWFEAVEKACSRFNPDSELRQLLSHVGEPVAVSPLLFQALDFALQVGSESGGAFDPTIGARMEAAGFTTDYLSGDTTSSGLSPTASGGIDDVILDTEAQTVLLRRPVVLDLGAVAKGFAMDLAGQELGERGGFAINAGGDVLVRGMNPEGGPWQIGVRHPRRPDALLCVLHVTNAAVCTSGDYERPGPDEGHHILDPHGGGSATSVISLTAIGPTAMTADALSTAAFVMGPERGCDFLEAQGLEALVVDNELTVRQTSGFNEYLR